MHDPDTRAFRVSLPLWRTKARLVNRRDGQTTLIPGHRRWLNILTVWHHDPQTDGSDDSCGWSRCRLTKDQMGMIQFWASEEAERPWLLKWRAKAPHSPADAECLMRGALIHMQRLMKTRVPLCRIDTLASELLHHPFDNIRGATCFLPGWHSNNSEETEADRKYSAERTLICFAKILLTEARPWWRHPRWHFHHWSVQVHAWQWFHRRFIARCGDCGARFKGRSVFTDWHGTRKWCADCETPRCKVPDREKTAI